MTDVVVNHITPRVESFNLYYQGLFIAQAVCKVYLGDRRWFLRVGDIEVDLGTNNSGGKSIIDALALKLTEVERL